MRILHIVPSYLPAVRYGGPITAVHDLCRALAAKGHEITVFTTNVDGPGNSPVPIGIPVRLDGVRIRYFSSPFLRRIYWAPELGRELRGEMRAADAVHLHSVFLWPTWAAARSARKAPVPYIVSPRGMLIKELIRRRSRFAKLAWIRLVERSNLERAASIHVTSQVEATELAHFGWRLPRAAIIPNGVDEPLSCVGNVASDVEVIASKGSLVLFLGRLSWKKGLDRLLHAFERTRAGNLAIVGTDDEGLAPRLTQLAASLGIAERVYVLPRTVIGAEKEHLFSAANVFALPSYSENFGNTVLEAMRRGVAVAVTPEVGAAAIVRASGGGIVAPGDADVFGAALSKLLEDPGLAHAMGQAGQRHTAAHYTWAQIAAQMEGLYASVAG